MIAQGVEAGGHRGIFLAAFYVIVKVTPFSIRKEIEEDQNTALAVVIGAVIIGLALIVSATVAA